MAEPMKFEFNINKEQDPEENIERLLKIVKLSAMEFITDEPLSTIPGHRYKITGLSIIGDPSFASPLIKVWCNQFYEYAKDFISGKDSFEEKAYQLAKVKYLIEEFRISHEVYSGFLVDIPETFILHTCDVDIIDEVTLNSIVHSDFITQQINEHLTVREKHFYLLQRKISLLEQELALNKMNVEIENSILDEKLSLQLTEIWIAIESVGMLKILEAKKGNQVIPKLRRKFFEVFQQPDKNYKGLRSKLIEAKDPGPHILPQMIDAYKGQIRPKVKKPKSK